MSYKFKNTRIESLTISKQILVTKMKSETKFLKHNQSLTMNVFNGNHLF